MPGLPIGYQARVLLLGFVGLLVLGSVMSWERRLPGAGETWSAQPRARRLVLVTGMPLGLAVTGIAALLLLDALTGATQVRGFYAGATVLALMAIAAGGAAITGMTARSLLRLHR